jgi:hypothetical protein
VAVAPLEVDALGFTKKQLLIEVVRLSAELRNLREKYVELEQLYASQGSRCESLQDRNEEILNKLLDRELRLEEPKNVAIATKGPQPVNRRQPWRNVAAQYTKNDRQELNDKWKARIQEVEKNDGMNAVSADAK